MGIKLEEALYPVSLKELKVEGPDNVLRARMATVDETSGEILGTVSRRFSLIQTQTLVDAMNEIKGEMKLELDKIGVCKGKRAVVLDYKLGDNETKVEASKLDDDKVGFLVRIVNSFDSALGGGRIEFLANRLVCMNGMVLPRENARITFRDLKSFTGTNLKDRLRGRMEPVMDNVHVWSSWALQTPNRSKLTEFLASNFRPKRVANFMEQYDKAKDQTTWGLYNLLTAYATHDVKSRDTDDLLWKQYEIGKTISKMYKIALN